jgi:hypothetical protein
MAASPADEPAPWEPVITRPDPMTAEEWEACRRERREPRSSEPFERVRAGISEYETIEWVT